MHIRRALNYASTLRLPRPSSCPNNKTAQKWMEMSFQEPRQADSETDQQKDLQAIIIIIIGFTINTIYPISISIVWRLCCSHKDTLGNLWLLWLWSTTTTSVGGYNRWAVAGWWWSQISLLTYTLQGSRTSNLSLSLPPRLTSTTTTAAPPQEI